jgi:hypothetical protein
VGAYPGWHYSAGQSVKHVQAICTVAARAGGAGHILAV